jgi:hypothetical protein
MATNMTNPIVSDNYFKLFIYFCWLFIPSDLLCQKDIQNDNLQKRRSMRGVKSNSCFFLKTVGIFAIVASSPTPVLYTRHW